MSIERITIMDNEEYLRQISEEIDFDKDNINEYIKVLDEYCSTNDCFAMASVQLGIPKRIMYIKHTTLNEDNYGDSNINERQIIINPVIKECYGETKYWENCMSCGDNMGLVKRPYKVLVEYYDEFKEFHTRLFEGFETTVFCHEFDHLNGILHLDKSEIIYNYDVEKRKEFRKTHPYEIISKDCIFEYEERKIRKSLNKI